MHSKNDRSIMCINSHKYFKSEKLNSHKNLFQPTTPSRLKTIDKTNKYIVSEKSCTQPYFLNTV